MKLVVLDQDVVIEGALYTAGSLVVVPDGFRAGIRRIVKRQIEREERENRRRFKEHRQPDDNRFLLSVTITGNGVVDVQPSQDDYSEGEPITLTADAAQGWKFSTWQLPGGATPKVNPLVRNLSKDTEIVAVFTDKPNGSAGGKHD